MHGTSAGAPVVLSGYGGLVTLAKPESVPEGASPRTYDTDFSVGGVHSRAGLKSVCYFSGDSVGPSPGTHAANVDLGGAAWLNPANILLNDTSYAQAYLNAVATAAGAPSSAVSSGGGAAWSNPSNLLGSSGYAVASLSSSGSSTYTASNVSTNAIQNGKGSKTNSANVTFSSVAVSGSVAVTVTMAGTLSGSGEGSFSLAYNISGGAWVTVQGWSDNLSSTLVTFAVTGLTNLSQLGIQVSATARCIDSYQSETSSVSGSAISATVSSSGGSIASQTLTASGFETVPALATITGLGIAFNGLYSGTYPTLTVALSGGGTVPSFTLGTSSTACAYGGNGNLWGLSALTTSEIASLAFNASIVSGTSSVSLNSLVVTIFYTLSADTNGLSVTGFGFNLLSTSSVIGIKVALKGFASVASPISCQVLKAGVPIGNVETLTLPTSDGFVYFGSATDGFGTTWTYSDINNASFGAIFSSASGVGLATLDLNYCTIQVFISNSATNFNFVSTFTAQNGAVKNIYLDANGNLYVEDVSNNPGALVLVSEGFTPNSYAVGINGPDVEYLALTDLKTGSDMPIQYTPNWIDRITQVGPGAAPSFSPIVSTSDTYPIATITQYPQQSTNRSGTPGGGDMCAFLWSAGPANTSTGTTVTVYYLEGSFAAGDPELISAFNSGRAVYVYITGAPFGNGTRQVTSIGLGQPPQSADKNWYFTFQMPTSNYQFAGSFPAGQYQLTMGTLTTKAPVPSLSVGNQITVAGASIAAWDNSWQITGSLNSAEMTITASVVASYIATYSWNVSQGTPPVKGQLVNITGTTNANGLLNGADLTIASSTAYGGIVNTSGTAVTWVSGDNFSALVAAGTIVINGASYVISTIGSSTALTLTATAGTQTGVTYNAGTIGSGTFTVVTSIASATSAPENGLATTAGTIYTIDPGIADVGGSTNPIFGNSTGGTLTYIGATAQLISPGTRQGTVFFITRNSYYTAPAPPVTFTVPENTLTLSVSNIPIGPPNVVARAIAITEAGQNGTPGGNFFTIPTPVQYVVNNVSYTASALIINDNVTTDATFSFTDSVLLNAEAIDVYAYNLFNQIEIGDPGWISSYDSRNWYGKCINKVQNFNNLSFDGGYLSGQLYPLGWTQPDVYGSLVNSPKFGQAYYIKNTTSGELSSAGLISQTAYQDAYSQAIINGNTAYSVRVTCSSPAAIEVGNLVVSLSAGGVTYGSFILALSAMSSSVGIFSGTLLVNQLSTVPALLTLNVFATGLGAGADILIDRVDIYPTAIPVLSTTVYGSYVGLPEQVDAVTGKVVFASENQEPVNGAMVLYDTFYALKGWSGNNPGSSLYSLQKSSGLEPAQWDAPEVSQRSGGAVGPLAFDLGEQWFVGASRSGLYLFVGAQPGKIMQEIYQVWDAINWAYGNTIWVKVDTTNRRIYAAVPMETPNFWLPNAPVNANPTSPNVILVCNFQGLDSGEQVKSEPQMHTTMFGTLNAIDMRRKWSLWQIPSPYANFVAGQVDSQFYLCNGRGNSKIYMLDENTDTDDGIVIDSLYTTAGLVEMSKRATVQGVGSARMRWGYMVAALESEGNIGVTLYPNRLLGPTDPTLGYSTWELPGGFSPGSPALNDAESPLNFAATRTFIEFRENDGHKFSLSNLSLHAKKDTWNALRGAK
jgi:hypothetical protein